MCGVEKKSAGRENFEDAPAIVATRIRHSTSYLDVDRSIIQSLRTGLFGRRSQRNRRLHGGHVCTCPIQYNVGECLRHGF